MSVEPTADCRFIEETTSENSSAGGVFVRTEAWALMPVGTRLYVAMEITSPNGQFVHPTRLKTVGRVVRVTRNGVEGETGRATSRGVAVQFERELRFSS